MKTKFSELHFGQAGIVAGSAAAFFTFLVPLQTYLANNDLFGFSAGAIVWEAMPWFLAFAAGTFVILALSEMILGRFVHVLAFATLLLGTLRSGSFPLDCRR